MGIDSEPVLGGIHPARLRFASGSSRAAYHQDPLGRRPVCCLADGWWSVVSSASSRDPGCGCLAVGRRDSASVTYGHGGPVRHPVRVSGFADERVFTRSHDYSGINESYSLANVADGPDDGMPLRILFQGCGGPGMSPTEGGWFPDAALSFRGNVPYLIMCELCNTCLGHQAFRFAPPALP